jgi:hypothetical protein
VTALLSCSLATSAFPFRALAMLAGRSPLGGPRETAFATLIAVRLALSAASPATLSAAVRGARAEAARLWMSSLTLPAPVRAALIKLVVATAGDDHRVIAAALDKVIDVTAPLLDRGARSELDRLGTRFAG